jgi:hypothetical protein
VAEAGDGELAEGAGVGGQRGGGVVVDFDAPGPPAGPGEGHGCPGAGGHGGQLRGDGGVAGWRARSVMKMILRSSSSVSWACVVSLESKISRAGSCPVTAFQSSANAITSRFWVASARSALEECDRRAGPDRG